MDDKKIISLITKKSTEGLYALIEKYRGLVGLIISRVLSNEADIEECVSDVFVSIWNNAHKIDLSKGSLKAYICATARNKAVSYIRKNSKEKSIPIEDIEFLPYEENSTLESKELLEMLYSLISELPEAKREILVRRYFYFEPISNIAKRFEMSDKQVKNYLYQTKLKLRKQLEEMGFSYE